MSFIGSDRSQRSMVYGSATATRTSLHGSHIHKTSDQRIGDPLALWNSPGHQQKASPADRMKFVISHAMTIEEAIEVSQEHTRVLQADIMKLQMELNDSLMKMESSLERADEAEAQVARLQVQCHEYEWQIKAQHGVDLDQNMELKRLREQIVALQTEKHLVISEKEHLGASLEDESRLHREEIQSLHQEINRLNAKLNHAEQSLSVAIDEQVRSSMTSDALRAENEAFKKQIANLHDQLAKTLKEKDNAIMMAKKANFDCEESIRKEQELSARLSAVETDRNQLREFGNELAETLRMSTTKKDQINNENKALRDEMLVLKADLTKQSNDMAMMRVTVDQTEQQLQRAKIEHERELAEQEETSIRKVQKVKAESATRAAKNETLSEVLEVTSRDLATTKAHLGRANDHKMAVLSKAISKMQHLSQFKCWNNWKEQVSHGKRLRAISGKIISRWLTRDVAKAFNTWLEDHRHAQKLQIVKVKIIDRWLKRVNSKAFNTWLENHNRQQRLQRVGRQIMDRWLKQASSKAFNTWLEQHQEVRRLAAAKNKILRRWMARGASRAFQTWLTAHKAEKERRHKLQGALGRWLKKTVSMAFGSWQASVEAQRAMRVKLARCVAMWISSTLGRALGTWLANTAWLAAIRKTARHVILRMQHRALAVAFGTLASGAWRQRRMRALSSRAVARWARPAMARVFGAWASKQSAADKMEIVLRRWRAGVTMAAFDKWAVDSSKEAAAAKQRSRGARRWANMWLNKAVNRWIEFVDEQQWEDRIKYRVITRIMHVKTAMAFSTWRASAHLSRDYRQSWRWVLRRSDANTKAWAWRSWLGTKVSPRAASWRRLDVFALTVERWQELWRKWHRMVAASCLLLLQQEAVQLLDEGSAPAEPIPPPASDLPGSTGLAAVLAQWGVTLESAKLQPAGEGGESADGEPDKQQWL